MGALLPCYDSRRIPLSLFLAVRQRNRPNETVFLAVDRCISGKWPTTLVKNGMNSNDLISTYPWDRLNICVWVQCEALEHCPLFTDGLWVRIMHLFYLPLWVVSGLKLKKVYINFLFPITSVYLDLLVHSLHIVALYRTQVLVLATECGFESRPWHLCPWARHLIIIASLHPGVKWVPVRAELVD